MLANYKLLIQITITCLIVLTVNLLSFFYQPMISNNGGKGMDGVDYYKISEDIVKSETPEARAPFVYRVGTPYLVSMIFPDDLLFGFKLINIIASSLIAFALLFFLNLYFRVSYLNLIPVSLYALSWHAPLRMSWYYPVHVDPLAILILILLLILLKRLIHSFSFLSLILFTLLSVLGVLLREINIIPAFVLILYHTEFKFKDKLPFFSISFKNLKFKYLLPFALAIFTILVLHFLVKSTVSYSFLAVAVTWIYKKSIFILLHSLFYSFGPILFLILVNFKNCYKYIGENKELGLILVIIFVLGAAGGSDTERIFYWAMPVVYLIFLVSIERISIKNYKYTFGLLVISQLISIRSFLLTPDYPNTYNSILPFLTPLSDRFPLLDLWVWHADTRVNIVSFGTYILLFATLYIIFVFESKKLKF